MQLQISFLLINLYFLYRIQILLQFIGFAWLCVWCPTKLGQQATGPFQCWHFEFQMMSDDFQNVSDAFFPDFEASS